MAAGSLLEPGWGRINSEIAREAGSQADLFSNHLISALVLGSMGPPFYSQIVLTSMAGVIVCLGVLEGSTLARGSLGQQ